MRGPWVRVRPEEGLSLAAQGPPRGDDRLYVRGGRAAGLADRWPSRCGAGTLWRAFRLEPRAPEGLWATRGLQGCSSSGLLSACALNSSPGLIPQEQTGVSAVCRKAGPRQEWGEVSGPPGPASPLISLSTCGRAAEEVIPVYATGGKT